MDNQLTKVYDSAQLIKEKEKFLSDLHFQVRVMNDLLKTNRKFINDTTLNLILDGIRLDPLYIQDDNFLKNINKSMWYQFYYNSGAVHLMHGKIKTNFLRELENGVLPEFSKQEVDNFYNSLLENEEFNKKQMLEDFYRYFSYDYTDSDNPKPIPLDKKVIRNIGYQRGTYSTYSETCQDVVGDFINTLRGFEGKPPLEKNKNFWDWLRRTDDRIEYEWQDYFDVKVFKNCNLHITFKRKDLIDKVNKMICGV